MVWVGFTTVRDVDSSTVYSVCYDALVQTVRTTKNKQVAVDCLHAATILLYINDSPNPPDVHPHEPEAHVAP